MDREWPAEERARLLEIARSVPGVAGAHDLRTRSSGVVNFAQFHIWLAPEMPVIDAHAIVDAVEHRLHDEFPGTEIFIHIDPLGHYDKTSQTLAELQEGP
jgi:ferrous-iron efflux pump FieF